MAIKKNIGQKRVTPLFTSGAREILLAAGSRCFARNTLVQAESGHKYIQDIKVGEYVLSMNNKTEKREYKKVLKTFHNNTEQSKQMIIFRFTDGKILELTENHEVYQKKNYIPAITIAKRAMESGKWHKRTLRSEQLGASKNVKLEEYRRIRCNDTKSGCEWLSSDNDKNWREVSNYKNAPFSCATLDKESRNEARGKSHQQRPSRQSCFQLGMGDKTRELAAHDGSRSTNYEQRFKEWNGNYDGRSGYTNTKRIRQRKGLDCPSMVRVFWSKIFRTTRPVIGSNMEACEIDTESIESITFYDAKVETFDLCVEDNHNYTVTEDNIIVHNSGKTFFIIYIMIVLAVKFANSRHMIARKHFAHAKGSIWADTLPKVIDICFPHLKEYIKWNNTDFFIELPNGSSLYVVGLDDKERVDKILGREYFSIFLNECSEMTFDVYETVKTRLAQKCTFINKDGVPVVGKNMLFADENPTSSKHWSKILFLDKIHPETKSPLPNPERYAFGQIHPWENEDNISEDYLEMLRNMSPAKKKRFYDGQFGDDNLNALWNYDMINNSRVNEASGFKRIVVSIDPAVTATDTSDETGIMVCGIGWNDHLYVLEDLTGTHTMTEWANVAVDAYERWNADRVVGEVNQGGDLVEMNIRNVAPNIPFTQVRGTKSKYTRAEPVASLYEQGKAHHVGLFPDLELEMTEWQGKKGDPSPNRIDALVWAAADLFPELGVNSRMTGNFVSAMQGYR